eukprot:TRINITY_DN68321_c0_g1_i1.p1 TRINITY_DN68321_c0_g1~~TRINITY_DN68321_c0_g1_i1.p1  ORF type:complete len:589 (-),score=88.92 TRINITY_DN68321_c0_g1_i1:47-1813(-)
MGGCESVVGPKLPVDLKRGPACQERWRQGLDSSLSDELLFVDCKAFTDFLVFLRDTGTDDAAEQSIVAWRLSLARFALRWSEDDKEISDQLASNLEASWDAYMNSPHGYGNFEDTREWAIATLSAGASRFDAAHMEASSADSSGNIINEEHSMYVFAMCTMMGINVATVCATISDACVARAAGRLGRAINTYWMESFENMSMLHCLQNSCYRYVVPPGGSAYSPPVQVLTKGRLSSSFVVEDYCPELFAQMRHLCGISNHEFLSSVCRPDAEFIEMGTNSCSGEFFFFTQDGNYILKTMTKREAESLMRMLPDLLGRFAEAPHSLLGRYCGIWRVYADDLDIDFLFFIMAAATQHGLPVQSTYDLKGSSKGRRAKGGHFISKDLDFRDLHGSLKLTKDIARQLSDAHAQDVELLMRHTIMDYSVLLQMHQIGTAPAETQTRDLGRSKVKLGATSIPHNSKWWHHNLEGSKIDGKSTAAEAASAGSGASNNAATWRPNKGILSSDGKILYTMSIIDMLMPFNWWYPKAQIALQKVASCGADQGYSRQSPLKYARRQAAMMRRITNTKRDDELTETEESEDSQDTSDGEF